MGKALKLGRKVKRSQEWIDKIINKGHELIEDLLKILEDEPKQEKKVDAPEEEKKD